MVPAGFRVLLSFNFFYEVYKNKNYKNHFFYSFYLIFKINISFFFFIINISFFEFKYVIVLYILPPLHDNPYISI